MLRGVPVAVVEVLPSDSPPVQLKGQVWVRVGPRRGIATAEEELRLTERRVAGVRTFNQRPCIASRLEDLALQTFRSEYLPRAVSPELLAANRRSEEQQLASQRFFDLRRGVPTNAGILVVGRDPLEFLPGAYIQFARIDGMTLADPVQDQKTISGSLRTQLIQLDNLLPSQIRLARRPAEGSRDQENPDYPRYAVREIVHNAVMHRNHEGTSTTVRINRFADRIEVQNPGGLYGQVTPQNCRIITDEPTHVAAVARRRP